jgi:hypothetical protein
MATEKDIEYKRKVYVIQDDDKCKIGISIHPGLRMQSMYAATSKELKLVYETEKLDDARLIERTTHRILKGFRIRREWFKVTPETAIAAINEALSAVKQNTQKRYLSPVLATYKKFQIYISPEEHEKLIFLINILEKEQQKRLSYAASFRLLINKIYDQEQKLIQETTLQPK